MVSILAFSFFILTSKSLHNVSKFFYCYKAFREEQQEQKLFYSNSLRNVPLLNF